MSPKASKSSGAKALTKKKNNATTIKHKHKTGGSRKDTLPVAQRILNNCAVLEARQGGDPKVSRDQVAAMCGGKTKGFVNALSILKNQKKQIDTIDVNFMALTDAGRQEAEAVATVGNNKEQLEQAKKSVKPQKGKIFMDLLADGGTQSRKYIADGIDFDLNAKGFKNLLSSLKSDNIIEYCKDEHGEPALRMCDWLFPFGRGA
mmetsp:Transcript_10458/g.21286  ORF Transcript_10458/g.21286 Transcript_10458/m.21286 type:complete len:204 (+) Transcript_10458:177-788(+)